MPSLAPTSSIRPSISQSPSASQAPSIDVPRGATLVGQGVCADGSNERYRSLEFSASEVNEGVSTRLCLEKCISLSSIMQLHLRGFERSEVRGFGFEVDWLSPCACLFDHDSDNNGGKLTEELMRENGFQESLSSEWFDVRGVGPVNVYSDCRIILCIV